ncbi:MAG: hypothetical protein ACLSH8_10610 [Zhenhengia sp.]|uniref:hypothetical protein n=1 Tax=Zhenhengia sp. TaxID=2944208 RepID=UPI00290BAD99|nr:hypothetical protein [Clostridiales bacterium]MDU6975844.1 hypothetical protein [Clostridiales bacterium]
MEEPFNKILESLQALQKSPEDLRNTQDKFSTIEKVTAKNCYDIAHLKIIKYIKTLSSL